MASKREQDPLFPLMRSLRKYEVLKAHEEIELARLIQAGEEEGASKRAKHKAKKALDKLVLCNMRLCVKVCKGVWVQYKGRLELSDLVAEGVFGLQTAAKRFDHTRGYKFSTYAYWWVRQAAVRAITNQSTAIRIPVSKWDLTSKYLKYRNQFVAENGREPTNDELMQNLSLTHRDIKDIEHAFIVQNHVLSFDAPQTTNPEESGGTFLDIIPSPSTYDGFEQQLSEDTLHILMQRLDERDQFIIQSRTGIYGATLIARKKLNKLLGISGERVRQRELAAYRKLRNFVRQNPQVDQRLHNLYN